MEMICRQLVVLMRERERERVSPTKLDYSLISGNFHSCYVVVVEVLTPTKAFQSCTKKLNYRFVSPRLHPNNLCLKISLLTLPTQATMLCLDSL
jgi:hypothetical protein